MTRVSRFTVGALVCGATLLPLAPAQAQAPLPTGTQRSVAQMDVDGGTGSSTQSIMCTIVRLMLMNQGPAWCQ
ncbi:hypothetical protein [Nocardia veterana]|uniref:Uncharacterized protein n=1 Tax=Nocardia veterana TaxID=132249 RepID=A0A7X6LUT2_9NOCA|nr:hypothetical protein [Nocardia veterana]NKY84449.1 hypothetical protein [Nocardia veterana]